MTPITLQKLAQRHDLKLAGEGATLVAGVCSLAPGKPGCISFLSNPRLRDQLATTQAAAVIVAPHDAAALGTIPGLIAADPYLAYARIAQAFDPDRAFVSGRDPSAVIAADADIGAGSHIGALAVIESGARIGRDVFVGPGCHVGRDAVIGDGARLVAQVHIAARVRLGLRVVVQPGAVVGARGFGNAKGPNGWEAVPQLGSVVVGDDVEIGANTCIDRGTIENTIIEHGVRLDNLIQIAHNCRIGAHTAIAAGTGVAGSTRIGARCMIGGACGITGHIEIADDVVLLGRTMVTGSIPGKGVYGSGMPMLEAREWRKTIARVRRLGKLEQRLKRLEQGLDGAAKENEDDGQDDV